jgi:cytoskeleton protein RodZ
MPSKATPIGFGRYLQTCRRSKGIGLEDISQQTKITVDILQQLENENLDRLPAPVFVKGFLKAFAQAVGADPQEAVQRFQLYLANRGSIQHTGQPISSGGAGNWLRLMLALVLFAALVTGTVYLAEWMQDTTTMPTLQPETSSPQVSDPPAILKEIESPAKIEIPAVREQTTPEETDLSSHVVMPLPKLTLRMTAVEATWLKVVVDNSDPREFMLKTDHDVTLVAQDQIDLVIGNAAGIQLILNDQPVPVVGSKGQVVALHLP